MPISQIIHDGQQYYSLAASARLLGTSVANLKKIMVKEGLDWTNLRVNGPLWISAESINSYLRRMKKQSG